MNDAYGITSENLLRALPEVLKNDEGMYALASGIAEQLGMRPAEIETVRIYSRIDELPESLLDILAYDLHVDWYDPDSPVEIKRTIIKESVKVHKRLGTKYAVESVVKAYFGSGEVRNWYEYGGSPHQFKVISGNPSITNEREKQFLKILDVVKRKSSWLDAILITLTGDSPLYIGAALSEFTREVHTMGVQDYMKGGAA